MLQQAIDFRDVNDALYKLLEPLEESDWSRKTQFKDWTVSDVIGHLHMWNCAADWTLNGDDVAFTQMLEKYWAALESGQTRMAFTDQWMNEPSGRKRLQIWREYCVGTAERFAQADPRARVQWAGPSMSVRSCITARLMETWSHGQALYDLLGVEREDSDSIKNIAVLGVNTYGWTFDVRGLEKPGEMPYLRLTAPSGAIWEWNTPNNDNRIEGSAVEFCQVVAQTRNVQDTHLEVTGEPATRWMSLAQCFAGGANEPPAPGTRFKQPVRPETQSR
jgi:uncharacterized protein (TIGR03084 family)